MKGPAGRIALAVAMGMSLPLIGFCDEQADAMELKDTKVLEATAKIVSIDAAKREVTIETKDGQQMTMTVDKKVQGLENLRTGDMIKAQYRASLALEIREPTSEEKADPLKVTHTGTVTDTSMAGTGRTIRGVCDVVSVDHTARTITFKGPMGKTFVVHAKESSDLSGVKPGKALVVTYTEGVAVSIQRAE